MKKFILALSTVFVSTSIFAAEPITCPTGPIPYNPGQKLHEQTGVWWGIWGTPGNTPNTFYLAGALGNKSGSTGTCVYTLTGKMPAPSDTTLLLSSDNSRLVPDQGDWRFVGNVGKCDSGQNCTFSFNSQM